MFKMEIMKNFFYRFSNTERLKDFLKTYKSTADQNYRSHENDRLIHARMRRIKTETNMKKTD